MTLRGLLVVVVVPVLTATAAAQPPPEPSHRRFAAGVALGIGADPGAEEVGFAVALRLGYRPVPRLAVLYALDLTIVDLDPEASISAHALVGQLELAPKIYLLAGPAIGVVSPPSGSVSGPGAMAAIGYRVQPFEQLGGALRGDVEVELRAHTAFRDGERFDAVLLLAGAGF